MRNYLAFLIVFFFLFSCNSGDNSRPKPETKQNNEGANKGSQVSGQKETNLDIADEGNDDIALYDSDSDPEDLDSVNVPNRNDSNTNKPNSKGPNIPKPNKLNSNVSLKPTPQNPSSNASNGNGSNSNTDELKGLDGDEPDTNNIDHGGIDELQKRILEKKEKDRKKLEELDIKAKELREQKQRQRDKFTAKKEQEKRKIEEDINGLEMVIRDLEKKNKELEEDNKEISAEISRFKNSKKYKQFPNDFKSEYDKKMKDIESKRSREKEKIESKWKSNGFKSFGEYLDSIKKMNSDIDKEKNELLNSSFSSKPKNDDSDIEFKINNLFIRHANNKSKISHNISLISAAKDKLQVWRSLLLGL